MLRLTAETTMYDDFGFHNSVITIEVIKLLSLNICRHNMIILCFEFDNFGMTPRQYHLPESTVYLLVHDSY